MDIVVGLWCSYDGGYGGCGGNCRGMVIVIFMVKRW